MRLLLAMILLVAAPCAAGAQTSSPSVLEAMRRSFPKEHAALVARLASQPRAAAPRLISEAMQQFQTTHMDAIVAAPGARLILLEAHHGNMLRALGRRDVRLCAIVGDRGFFGPEARAGAPAPGLDGYATALVETAAAGAGRAAPSPPTAQDFQNWLALVERREPAVPVRAMLTDRERRAAASAEHLCAGAAAMHEAIADLPPEQGARVAAALVRSTFVTR